MSKLIGISWPPNTITFVFQVSLISSFQTFARYSSAWEPYASVAAGEIWSTRNHQASSAFVVASFPSCIRHCFNPRLAPGWAILGHCYAFHRHSTIRYAWMLSWLGSFYTCPLITIAQGSTVTTVPKLEWWLYIPKTSRKLDYGQYMSR